MVCGCEWTKNIKILAARARVSTTFDTATRATGAGSKCGYSNVSGGAPIREKR